MSPRARAPAPASIVVALLLASCAAADSGPPEAAANRSPMPAQNAPQVYAPLGEGAELYNGEPGTAPPRTALVDAVLAALADIAGETRRPLPMWDSRLYGVATDLARVVPDNARLSYIAIEFAMQHYGIIEPTPHLLVIWTARRNPGPLSEFVADRLRHVLGSDSYARLGIGLADRDATRTAIVIILQRSFIETEPIRRVVSVNGKVKLRGRILSPYGAPEVLVTRDDGSVTSSKVKRRAGGKFSADVYCRKKKGRLQIEVSGHGPEGATVLANFPIWCGEKPPTEIALAVPTPNGTGANAIANLESQLVAWINDDRRRAGLAPLEVDPAVADVAHQYSVEMAATGIVAHVSPTSGTADDRLRRAGIVRPLVQENLARAATVDEVHVSLMNSPGHRANILSADATHVGVGIVLAHDELSDDLFVTELFTRIPPSIDPGEARNRITKAIRGSRRLRLDSDLGRMAQIHADDLARGVPKNVAAAKAARGLSILTGRYGRVRTVILTVSNVDQVLASKLPNGSGTTHFGVGIAQGHHEKLGDGTIYVVVVFGQRA